MENQGNKLELPSIVTANCFYWNSGRTSSIRRANEERRQKEVFDFFHKAGFQVERHGDYVTGSYLSASFEFYYSETCNNVIKRFEVYRDGKKSNISLIKKMLNNLSK